MHLLEIIFDHAIFHTHDWILEFARVVAYLLLVPGMILRSMFLLNRGLTPDAVTHLVAAFFFFGLLTPFLLLVYNGTQDQIFLIPATIVGALLAFLVAYANALDVRASLRKYRQDRERKQREEEEARLAAERLAARIASEMQVAAENASGEDRYVS